MLFKNQSVFFASGAFYLLASEFNLKKDFLTGSPVESYLGGLCGLTKARRLRRTGEERRRIPKRRSRRCHPVPLHGRCPPTLRFVARSSYTGDPSSEIASQRVGGPPSQRSRLPRPGGSSKIAESLRSPPSPPQITVNPTISSANLS